MCITALSQTLDYQYLYVRTHFVRALSDANRTWVVIIYGPKMITFTTV
jgi:hypothetical protein